MAVCLGIDTHSATELVLKTQWWHRVLGGLLQLAFRATKAVAHVGDAR